MPSLPPDVVGALQSDGSTILAVDEEPVDGGTGAATASVARLSVRRQRGPVEEDRVVIVRKRLEPLRSGRHAPFALEPRHWAYWRREAEAYLSGLLPHSVRFRAPRCFGVVAGEIYLEDVGGEAVDPRRAAADLATWQVDDRALDRPWIAEGQLRRRLEASTLDWTAVEADERVVELWSRRAHYLDRLAEVPTLLAHGDFSLGNLRASASGTVAFDWATLGWEPLGFDLAHLALSSGEDPLASYLESDNRFDPGAVDLGFRLTAALVGASRIHWMLSSRVEVPDWYVDFLWDHRPRS